jgi:hypothetical protein
LAGRTPEAAVDSFIARVRLAVACFVDGVIVGSGNRPDAEHALTLYVSGQTNPNLARLRTHGGSGELLFRFIHHYAVKHEPREGQRGLYEVTSLRYHYDVLDRDEAEIMVFHWDPDGGRGPHLHVSAAPSIILPQPPGSSMAMRRTMLGDLHIPSGHVSIEDLVELLIAEFHVVPRLANWKAVIAENRSAARNSHF